MASSESGWFALATLALAVGLAMVTAGMLPPGNGEPAGVAVAAAPDEMVTPDSAVAGPRTGTAPMNAGSWRSVLPGLPRAP